MGRQVYGYDALDRLAFRSSAQLGTHAHFYCMDTLAAMAGGGRSRRFLRGGRHLLAQKDGLADSLATALILPNRVNSVLAFAAGDEPVSIAYCPYGHRETSGLLPELPGFNGEHPDPLTGHYLLGNGYRALNPVLMRFNSPDSFSPFGDGGLNAYAYCAGDPVNRTDPSGHDLLDTILSGLYITAGVATAVIGLAAARASVPALWKGVKVVPKPDSVTGIAAAPHYRPATTVDKITAVVPIAAVAAGATWLSSFVVRAAKPDSPAARILSMIAVGIAVPTLVARGGLFVRTERLKRITPLAASTVPRPSVKSVDNAQSLADSLSRRGSEVRHGRLGRNDELGLP